MALSVEDVQAIQQLAARYNHTVDSGDGPGFAATFTETGVLINTQRIEGRQALAAFAESVPKMMPKPRHVVSNIVLDGDADRASLKAYLQVSARPSNTAPPHIVVTGVYEDTLTRESGEWLFAERVFYAD